MAGLPAAVQAAASHRCGLRAQVRDTSVGRWLRLRGYGSICARPLAVVHRMKRRVGMRRTVRLDAMHLSYKLFCVRARGLVA
eukprot:4792718-Prymnesium_polylepis.2